MVQGYLYCRAICAFCASSVLPRFHVTYLALIIWPYIMYAVPKPELRQVELGSVALKLHIIVSHHETLSSLR